MTLSRRQPSASMVAPVPRTSSLSCSNATESDRPPSPSSRSTPSPPTSGVPCPLASCTDTLLVTQYAATAHPPPGGRHPKAPPPAHTTPPTNPNPGSQRQNKTGPVSHSPRN